MVQTLVWAGKRLRAMRSIRTTSPCAPSAECGLCHFNLVCLFALFRFISLLRSNRPLLPKQNKSRIWARFRGGFGVRFRVGLGWAMGDGAGAEESGTLSAAGRNKGGEYTRAVQRKAVQMLELRCVLQCIKQSLVDPLHSAKHGPTPFIHSLCLARLHS